MFYDISVEKHKSSIFDSYCHHCLLLEERIVDSQTDCSMVKISKCIGLESSISFKTLRKKTPLSRTFGHFISGETKLHHAVIHAEVLLVQSILENERNLIDKQDHQGKTALHQAARNGNEAIAKMLLNAGANARLQDESGHTPLHIAVIFNHENIVETICKKDIGNNVQDIRGSTVLHCAVNKRNLGIVKKLLIAGVSASVQDVMGRTPLHLAVAIEVENIVDVLCVDDSVKYLLDKEGRTALHYAVSRGFRGIMRKLLFSDTNILLQDEHGQTLLHTAILHQYVDVAEAIIEVNGTNSLQDEHGMTPLHYAVMNEYDEIISRLLSKGANTRVKDEHGWTPLHIALIKGELHIAEIILDTDARNTLQDEDGFTPLHFAARRRYEGVVRKLLLYDMCPSMMYDDMSEIDIVLLRKRHVLEQISPLKYRSGFYSVFFEDLPNIQSCIEVLTNCYADIQQMKETKVHGTAVSYYDIAVRDVSNLAVLFRNANIRKVLLQGNVVQNFPNYCELITLKIQKAETRRILNEQCLECFTKSDGQLSSLPIIVFEEMFAYLNEEEMKNLIYALNCKT